MGQLSGLAFDRPSWIQFYSRSCHLVIFALFQGWRVDDDIKRQAVDDIKRRACDPNSTLVKATKYVLFLGLAAYLTFRPLLSSFDDKEA